MNYDVIPHPDRAAYFRSRGGARSDIGGELLLTSTQVRSADPARTAYFLGKQAAARGVSPIRPANRFAERDAADRRRLEAKRQSPVFVTDELLREWAARR